MGNMSYLDPKLLGKWLKGRRTMEFLANGQLLAGSVNNPYRISDDGNTLTVGRQSIYTRTIPGGKGLIGTWTDADGNELVTYRPDGFYYLTFANERVAYFGEFVLHDEQFDSKEFKAFCHSENGKLYYQSMYFEACSADYFFRDEALVLQQPDGKEEVYERMP